MIVGLCHGVFDVLHFGHINHFKVARAMCDELVVSVTADEFVNKGPKRPVFTLEQRMTVLSAISYIDRVIPSRNPTAVQSLVAVRPAIYFKDAEYRVSKHAGFLEEAAFCSANGIDLMFTEESRSSSTWVLQKLSEDL